MKKSILAKIGAAAVVLTLVTSSLVGGTFAKYTSSANGTANATVAKWNVAFKEGDSNTLTQDFAFNLKNENDAAETAENVIAPGSTGKIQLTVDGTDTQVEFSYEITADISKLNGVPLKFYSDENRTKEIEPDADNANLISLSAETIKVDGGKVGTGTVYWAWKSNDDVADTTLGVAGASGQIALSLSATQITGVEPATP